MRNEVLKTRPLTSMSLLVVAAIYALVVATGILAIGLSLAAWYHGTNVVEYYQHLFPRFRGGAAGMRIPTFGYVVFTTYIIVAASIAVHVRRRMARAWPNRRRGR